MKGEGRMNSALELNRLEYMILSTLHHYNRRSHFDSMSISEIMEVNEGCLGTRMTIYKKMKKLVNAGYIAKGILDNHADTFYLTEKGIAVFEGGLQA